MSNPIANPIFVISRPRCGSTLLRSVLSAHSQIQLVNESDLIVSMLRLGYNTGDEFDPSEKAKLIDGLGGLAGAVRHLQTLPAGYLDEFLADQSVLDFKQVYEALLPKPQAAGVWGDKCVGSSLYTIGDLLDLYPQALVIHIARDPRAVMLSTYQKRMAGAADRLPPFSRESIAFFAYEAMRWDASMAAFQRAKQQLAGGQVYELAFEEFVSDPEREIRGLMSAIGLEYEATMLDSINRRHDPVLRNDCAFAHQNLSKPIDSTRAQGGAGLPDWASYVIQRCAAESLTDCGYQLRERPSLFHRGVIHAGLAAFSAKMQKRLARELAWTDRKAPRYSSAAGASDAGLLQQV